MQQGDGSAVLADLHGPEPEVPQGAIGGAVQARAFGLKDLSKRGLARATHTNSP
jgi:hypothetical protein